MPWPHDTTPLRNSVQSFLTAKHEPTRAGATGCDDDERETRDCGAGAPQQMTALSERSEPALSEAAGRVERANGIMK